MTRLFACFILFVLLCLGAGWALAGELYLELGVGHDRHIDEGRNPQSVIRLRYETPNNKWWVPDVLEYDHHSSIQNGFPFNRQPEDLADQASIIWRFRLR